ncbi:MULTISPECIES: AAA family ATPase [Actinomyces]|uniref:AAA family ATPase n=1 Tax=Actinomyces respiraculi TaxID=2744574 RepID=A0A7T0LLT0_9ACTO|nr:MULTISPECIES: ATP-binding protein [Actinomyces]QPL05493.1 AAA family ATPase [Actinomyces respiraculi]
MLRYLRIHNWKSYYEPVEFTMVATRERRHGERLAKVGRSRILPVAAVYGANASGKSTLVDALEALRGLILEARPVGAMLRLTPHLLKGAGEPTSFTIEFVAGAPRPDGAVEDRTFLYDVVADRRRIHRESLVEVRSRTEEVLFEREGRNVELYGDLDEDERVNAHKTVIADNETFLGVLGADSEGVVSVAYDWFARHLTVIHPGAEYVHLPSRLDVDAVFADAMNAGLTRADTGISKLDFEDMSVGALSIPSDEVDKLVESLREAGGTVMLSMSDGDHTLLTLDDDGEPVARRLVARHEVELGPGAEDRRSFSLPLREESDGTRRFMNLLPILFQLRAVDERSVFVVDELESSMHPRLTEELIASFLDGLGPEGRRQLIFTTHEIQLMRSDLLRRDEIWLADKVDGRSVLARVSDFADVGVRKDADLLGFYMSGRIGGVPRV